AQLVLLDEPAAGLDRDESRTLADRFRTLAQNGLSVLVIDHDVNLLLDVCDQIYVLDVGKVVAAGPPAEIRAREDLVAAHVGRRAPSPTEQLQPSAGGAAP